MQPELLKIIADNPALTEALRTVFEKHFSLDVVSERLTNEHLGEIVRARVQGLENIRNAFREIEGFKSVKEAPKEPPAFR